MSALQNIILFMLYSFIPVDMINGLMLMNGYLSISFYFKSTLFFLILTYLFVHRKKVYVALVIIVLISFLLIHSIISNDIQSSFKGIDWLLKFAGITAYFMFFRQLLKSGQSKSLFLFAHLKQ